jgi:phage shock protein PspC (stress-responsive transcriptional regulator)
MKSRSSQPRLRGPRGLRDPAAWHRNYSGRRVAGVCESLAQNLEISVSAVRLAFVLLALIHGMGFLLYGVFWALLPGSPGEPAALDRWLAAARRFLADDRDAVPAGVGSDVDYEYDRDADYEPEDER